MYILWINWKWPRIRRRRRASIDPIAKFAVICPLGDHFLAEGGFSALKYTAVHRLSCQRIGKHDRSDEETIICANRTDRQLVSSFLAAERRQRDKVIWAEILNGTPTHQLSWGYTLRASGEYRALVEWAFNFDLVTEPPSWEIARRVCKFLIFQAQEDQATRWGLLRSESSVQFWHLAIARCVINLI